MFEDNLQSLKNQDSVQSVRHMNIKQSKEWKGKFN